MRKRDKYLKAKINNITSQVEINNSSK